MIINVIKVLLPAAFAFFAGIVVTPVMTHFFFKYKMWKRTSRNENVQSAEFHRVHNSEEELRTPRVGGIIIWLSVVLSVALFILLSNLFPTELTGKLNFISRDQTIIPFFALLFASLVGLSDDLLQIYGKGSYSNDNPMFRFIKAFLIIGIGILISLWFYYKLGISSVHIPFGPDVSIGFLFIPFFIIVMLATFSGGVIDGIDGLSGGVFSSIFSAYSVIAFANHQINLSVFCAVLAGAILAFLWFNIPPARFYMGETGIMGLTVVLAVVAFLTNTVLVLPIIAMPLVITSLSVIIQLISKRFRHGKKVFKIAPLHHHFKAIGWPPYKVTMRFWILSVISSILGVIIALIS